MKYTRILGRLWPRSLTAQLICLLLGAVIVTHLVLGILLAEERRDALISERRGGALARVASIARILAATPSENWRDVMRVAEAPQIRLRLIRDPDDQGGIPDPASAQLSEKMNEVLDFPPVPARVSILSETECHQLERDARHEKHDWEQARREYRAQYHDRQKGRTEGDGKTGKDYGADISPNGRPVYLLHGRRFFDGLDCGAAPVMRVSVPIFSNVAVPQSDGDTGPAAVPGTGGNGTGNGAGAGDVRGDVSGDVSGDVTGNGIGADDGVAMTALNGAGDIGADGRDFGAINRMLANGMPDDRPVIAAIPDIWLEARVNAITPPPWLVLQNLLRVVLSAVVIGVIAFFIARRMSRSWTALAAAADRVGRGDYPEPVSETGPIEMKRAARAFNRMTARLKRFVEDRTRMLAAISHDLRTPITSLRLRAEFIEDEENRSRIIETLNEMEQMVEAAMTFAREETVAETTRRTDMAALIDAMVDDLAETGHPVRVQGEMPVLVYPCRPLSIKRALGNLVSNALRYSSQVEVAMKMADDGGCWIEVADNGPGIAPAQREQVFEPFVRLDTSRNRETGGIGLGLAIARTAIRAHGGEIYLEDAALGGLLARIYLPPAGLQG